MDSAASAWQYCIMFDNEQTRLLAERDRVELQREQNISQKAATEIECKRLALARKQECHSKSIRIYPMSRDTFPPVRRSRLFPRPRVPHRRGYLSSRVSMCRDGCPSYGNHPITGQENAAIYRGVQREKWRACTEASRAIASASWEPSVYSEASREAFISPSPTSSS